MPKLLPLALFTQSQGFATKRSAFKVGMKLEGIDPPHPNMFCVMTVAEQIDGRAFLPLTQRDIIPIMSIKRGPALKIYNSILMLKHEECFKGDNASSHHAGKKRSPDEEKNPSANEDDKQARDADGGDEKDRAPGENVTRSHANAIGSHSQSIAIDADENQSSHGDVEEKHASDEKRSCDRERAHSSHDVEKQRDAETRESSLLGKTTPRPNIKPEKTLPLSYR